MLDTEYLSFINCTWNTRSELMFMFYSIMAFASNNQPQNTFGTL